VRALSLCSGYSGLDLAIEAALPMELVAVADVDPDACRVLEVRRPGVPNLGDIKTVDWSTLGRIDVLSAGYPCQPFSQAGRRLGGDDERHLWPHVLAAVCELRPGLVVLENVAGHLSLGFDRVLADLAEAGFDAEWCVLRASDVGAPHQRARLFVAAYPRIDGREGWRRASRPGEGPRAGGGATPDAADTDGLGRSKHGEHDVQGPAEPQDGHDVDRRGPSHGGGTPSPVDWGLYWPAIERWERLMGRRAPEPLCGRTVNARLVEWMMGLPEGWVTDLIPNRRALKVLGNGVVPQQAAAALRELLSCLGEPIEPIAELSLFA
jgi:DNA (cytosine-5)-methyltransferase 1